jgi:hypothetical protein
MNINLLIDSLVRQTTVLIAHLATAAGSRAQLSNVANQVFADLIRELKEQGLGNKVIADMFGLSIRNYHYKVRRLLESNTERGRSLWEAILSYIQESDSNVDRKTVKERPAPAAIDEPAVAEDRSHNVSDSGRRLRRKNVSQYVQ